MSNAENTRVNAAIAKNIGIRWCSSCQSDKPADGFKRLGASRWICGGCVERRKGLRKGKS